MRSRSGIWFWLMASWDLQNLRVWMRAPILLVSLSSAASNAQITLIADAHVNSALPTVNSGGISNLNVGGGYSALLQFDLSLLPIGTTAAQIQRAVLRIYCNRATTPGPVSISPIAGPWSEANVTFATMPSIGNPSAALSVAQAGQYVAVDVTGLVQGWVSAPATNYGVALTAATAALQFDSKENDETSHPATLDVVLVDAGPAGATGATGSAGAAGPVGATGPPGATGLTGAAGATGAQGQPGSVGPAGPQGPQGQTGAQGAVGPAGTSGPAGNAGASGPAGAPATVTVGTVTTGAAGTQATVTNAGTNSAAVLNFTIPRGAAGTGGSGATSGISFASVYHGGSFGDLVYSVTNSSSSATESAPLLAWVPAGCSATELTVFSQQTTPITVTLRAGPVANLANTALACAVAAGGSTGASCTATGSVAVAAGDFVDLGVSGANGTGAVWTALQCN
jgi:hypothetical protein